MEIVGDRKFVEVPGSKTHELPPLLVRRSPELRRLDRVVGMAQDLIEQEEIIPLLPADAGAPESLAGAQFERERRRFDLALNLVDRYLILVQHWQWGDGVLEWIRQCETTFGSRLELRHLLCTDVWPHAGRSSFVLLLEDKHVDTCGVDLERAVGMRLTFRQPPPLKCFSDQFLFYLNTSAADTVYKTWAELSPSPVGALPPERFRFDVVDMSAA
jgi:hypothetical protein